MLESVLPFSPDLAEKVLEYRQKHSESSISSKPSMYLHIAKKRFASQLGLPTHLQKHLEWTLPHHRDPDIRGNAEMMFSRLQGRWMIWTAQ